MFARQQLEHGDCLSQRTLRLLHIWQLRSFGADAGVGPDDVVLGNPREIAIFSESGAEAAIDAVTSGTCDILSG